MGEEDGFPEMAEEMEKRVGISKGIENRRATCSEAFQRLGDGALEAVSDYTGGDGGTEN